MARNVESDDDVEGKERVFHEGREERGKEGHWKNTRWEMLITLGGQGKQWKGRGFPMAGRTIMWREKGKKKEGLTQIDAMP